METPEWREEAGGTFVAEMECFTLIVRRTPVRQHARFCVLGRRPDGTDTLRGSGTADGIPAAMNSAERMVERLASVDKLVSPLVMVVDDNESVRGTVADVLRDNGYQVVEASSGEGALRRLDRTTTPAVLISDIDLGPGMSGLELVATVHKLWPMTGVLLVSGDDAPPAGNDEFLGKPFSTDRLLGRVAAIAASG